MGYILVLFVMTAILFIKCCFCFALPLTLFNFVKYYANYAFLVHGTKRGKLIVKTK